MLPCHTFINVWQGNILHEIMMIYCTKLCHLNVLYLLSKIKLGILKILLHYFLCVLQYKL